MTGMITFEFVAVLAAVIAPLIAALLWINGTFQTKRDAAKSEERIMNAVNLEIKVIKESVAGLHEHVKAVKTEIKEEMKDIHSEIRELRNGSTKVAIDTTYIRARMEGLTSFKLAQEE